MKEALRQGFDVIGFSEHAPLPLENGFAIPEEKLEDYKNHILYLREKYSKRIEIYLSLEMDYIPGVTPEFSLLKEQMGLDYVIGSIHLVKYGATPRLWFIDGPQKDIYDEGLRRAFGGDIRAAVKAYFRQMNEMIASQKPDIIGHMDKVKMHNKGRYFSTSDKWYRDLVRESLDVIRENDAIVEVNTRGIYKKRSETLFPDETVFPEIRKRNIPLTITSDAHRPADLSEYFSETIRILQDAGIREVVCYKENKWQTRPL